GSFRPGKEAVFLDLVNDFLIFALYTLTLLSYRYGFSLEWSRVIVEVSSPDAILLLDSSFGVAIFLPGEISSLESVH
ncbi:11456_t:CDS:2, partial [Gigaspora rosea]